MKYKKQPKRTQTLVVLANGASIRMPLVWTKKKLENNTDLSNHAHWNPSNLIDAEATNERVERFKTRYTSQNSSIN